MTKKDSIIDARNIGMFVKFVEERYVSSTLEGNLYFSSTKYFKKHAARYKDKKMGDVYDPNESTDSYKLKTTAAYIRGEGQKNITKLPVNKINLNFSTKKPYGICSFMFLNFFDFVEDSNIATEQEQSIRTTFKIKNNFKVFRLNPSVIDQLKLFLSIEEKNKNQKCVPLIFSTKEFIKTVHDPNNGILYGLVKYHDFDKLVGPEEIPDYGKKNEVEVLFHKNKTYEGQREYRLVKPIEEEVKGKEFYYSQLRNHIFESSISDLERRLLIIEYSGKSLYK